MWSMETHVQISFHSNLLPFVLNNIRKRSWIADRILCPLSNLMEIALVEYFIDSILQAETQGHNKWNLNKCISGDNLY